MLVVERRFVSGLELREDDDGDRWVSGYAAVTDHPYDVAGGPPYGFSETIARGAFKKTLAEKDDVKLLANHEGIAMARTKSGTLTLVEDDNGLRVDARLDPKNPNAAEVLSALERGDLDEMSFAFRATRQEWNEDYTERIVREVQLFDVSLVTYPANPATVAKIAREAVRLDELRSVRTAGRISLDYARLVLAGRGLR